MKYVIFSHYERDFDHSVASSIYNVFLKKGAPEPAHAFYKIDSVTNALDLLGQLVADHTDDHVYVFNGLTNLGFPIFLDILAFLIPRKAKIVIYWHESSWNLRAFRHSKQAAYDKAFALLKCADYCYHWATNKKIRELIFFLTGCPSERVSVVYETIFPNKNIKKENSASKKKLLILGGGIPDRRKGVGYFIKMSKDKNLLPDKTTTFAWHAARPSRVKPLPKDFGDLGKVSWRGCAKNFKDKLMQGDAFILTSVDDPCPIVALEALDAGLPVFCFSTVGTSELLPREFVAESYQELTIIINNYFKNPKKPEFFKKIAKQYYPEHFTSRISFDNPGNTYNYPIYSPNPESKIFENLYMELSNSRAREHTAGIVPSITPPDLISRPLHNEIHKEARMEVKKVVRAKENIKKGAKVLVVGNSPSIKNYEYGSIIDKFDVVIRLNNFQIKGYEKYVGKKTDKAFLSFASKPNPIFKRIPNKDLYLFTANLHQDPARIKKRLASASPPGCGVSYDKVNKLSPTLYYYGLRILMGLSDNQWATTGLVTIQWAFDMFGPGNVYVHGFSFFSESQDKLKHYFPVETTRDIHHNFVKEKNYVMGMVNKGIVKTLPGVTF